MPVPSQGLDLIGIYGGFFSCSMIWGESSCFVDNGKIVDHHCLNFLSIMSSKYLACWFTPICNVVVDFCWFSV